MYVHSYLVLSIGSKCGAEGEYGLFRMVCLMFLTLTTGLDFQNGKETSVEMFGQLVA